MLKILFPHLRERIFNTGSLSNEIIRFYKAIFCESFCMYFVFCKKAVLYRKSKIKKGDMNMWNMIL